MIIVIRRQFYDILYFKKRICFGNVSTQGPYHSHNDDKDNILREIIIRVLSDTTSLLMTTDGIDCFTPVDLSNDTLIKIVEKRDNYQR